jgi:hypothetical protein
MPVNKAKTQILIGTHPSSSKYTAACAIILDSIDLRHDASPTVLAMPVPPVLFPPATSGGWIAPDSEFGGAALRTKFRG